jgi:hypothetical protein
MRTLPRLQQQRQQHQEEAEEWCYWCLLLLLPQQQQGQPLGLPHYLLVLQPSVLNRFLQHPRQPSLCPEGQLEPLPVLPLLLQGLLLHG